MEMEPEVGEVQAPQAAAARQEVELVAPQPQLPPQHVLWLMVAQVQDLQAGQLGHRVQQLVRQVRPRKLQARGALAPPRVLCLEAARRPGRRLASAARSPVSLDTALSAAGDACALSNPMALKLCRLLRCSTALLVTVNPTTTWQQVVPVSQRPASQPPSHAPNSSGRKPPHLDLLQQREARRE